MGPYRGHYFDGRTAGRHEARVTLTAQGLNITDADGAALAFWSFSALRSIDRHRSGIPLRLGSAADPDARLVVDEAEFSERLAAAAPELFRHPLLAPRRWVQAVLVVAAVTAIVAGAFYGVPRLAGPLAALLPLEWEEALGERVVDEMGAGDASCAAAAGTAALERLGRKLATAVDSPYRFTFHVADSDEFNAFAAPGGHIVLLRGLIERAETADEIAGVLAHEMGHVVHRHPTKGLIRRLGLMLILEGIVGGGSSLADVAAGLGATLAELSYSRDDEAAADAAAVDILARAGLRGDGLVLFFDRLAALEEERNLPGFLGYLSSHPPSGARKAAVAARVGSGGQAAVTSAEWQALRTICAK